MSGRKIVYTKALVNLIAGCIFDGLTDEETGLLAGVHGSTIGRLRAGTECKEIKISVVERMRKYIALIRDGEDRSNRWQRIAWFLERRYPDRWAKPEVLLNINSSGANVTNNTLVITAEQAQGLRNRNASLDEQLQKLVPPASRTGPIIPIMSPEHIGASVSSPSQDPNNNELANKTLSSPVVLAGEGAAPTGTPDARAEAVEPILPPNSKILKGYTTKKKSVKNSRNSDFIPPGGIVESPQSPESIASGEKGDTKREQLLKSLEFSRKPARAYHPSKNRGTENVPLPPAPRGPKAGRK